jgi:hypothetical protein
MTDAEKCCRDAAAKADEWAVKAETSGRLEDTATLAILAAAALYKADRLAIADAEKPTALQNGAAPSPTHLCALCGAPCVLSHGGLLAACTSRDCVRYGTPGNTTRVCAATPQPTQNPPAS